MKINARPNINGNTPKNFQDAALALSDAISDAEKAISHIRSEVMNLRNYQHIEGEQMYSARDEDILSMVDVRKALDTLRKLEWSILEIGMEADQ